MSITIDIWTVMTVLAVACLALWWGSKNAVWGGFTIGLIVGLIYAGLTGFEWMKVWHVSVVITLLGVIVELPATYRRIRRFHHDAPKE